ncbi:MAG: hypothetical protein N2V74_07315 [Candidatus Methanospirare jalkutatii]|nr:MAG: hypothetical protein N2V74_07315 [Candidatus Methanospirare jalkutatii]
MLGDSYCINPKRPNTQRVSYPTTDSFIYAQIILSKGGGAVAIAGEPAQSRSKIAGITSNPGSICGWDKGCWVTPCVMD